MMHRPLPEQLAHALLMVRAWEAYCRQMNTVDNRRTLAGWRRQVKRLERVEREARG